MQTHWIWYIFLKQLHNSLHCLPSMYFREHVKAEDARVTMSRWANDVMSVLGFQRVTQTILAQTEREQSLIY